MIGIYADCIVLTKRSANLRSFTGHVCLPGGQFDLVDNGIVDTAVREFSEEINFTGEITPIFCMLPECSVVSGHAVYPVVAKLEGSIEGFNLDEVDKIIYLNKDDLTETLFQINPNYPNIVHNKCFYYANEFTWGLTAHILYKFTLNYKSFFEGNYE